MTGLHALYLNDNRELKNIPAELSQCPQLTILSVENCPLHDLPQPIVAGGSAMIIYVRELSFSLPKYAVVVFKPEVPLLASMFS